MPQERFKIDFKKYQNSLLDGLKFNKWLDKLWANEFSTWRPREKKSSHLLIVMFNVALFYEFSNVSD